MTNLKTLVLATALGLGFAGAASAQVFPGVAGTPGRGNSDIVAIGPNGAPVSNGYLAEPYQFIRGDLGAYARGGHVGGYIGSDERPLRGSPNSPNVVYW